MTISNLSEGTTYYFGIKTSDEVPNVSGPSNVVSSRTLACGSLASGLQTYFVRTSTMPQIMQVDVNPLDVQSGASQTVSVKIRDTNNNPITAVSGTVNIDTTSANFTLTLSAGTDVNGTWQGSWTRSGTICTTYNMRIQATSASGQSTVDLFLL